MSDKSAPILCLQDADFKSIQGHKVPDMNLFLLSKTDDAAARLSYCALVLIQVFGCERPEENDMVGILEVASRVGRIC